jgi:signal transduction histidine kinase
MKFTPSGGQVTVTAAPRDGMVEFAVTDTGDGIPPEHQARVFDKFYQAAPPTGDRKMSSGIGLTFCRLAVEAHGGRIGVASDVGRGSRFWFTLPSGSAELPAPGTGSRPGHAASPAG